MNTRKIQIRTMAARLLSAVVPLVGALVVVTAPLHAGASGKWILKGKVNINEAPAQVLTLLPGIGPSKARAIVRYRKVRRFRKPSDITRIRGIGWKTYRKLRKYIAVSGPTTLRRVKEGGSKDKGREGRLRRPRK